MEEIKCVLATLAISLPIILMVVFFKYQAHTETLGRAEARRLALRNLVLYLSTLGLVVLYMVLPNGIRLALHDAFFLAVLAAIVKFLFDRLSSGKTLLDLGYDARNALSIVMCVLSLYMVLPDLTGPSLQNDDPFSTWRVWIELACPIYFLLVGLNKIAITEQGIFVRAFLIRWTAIQSYRWLGNVDNTLLIRTRSPIKWFQVIPIDIPATKKEAVRILVRERRAASAS